MNIYEKIFARLEELHMSQIELSRRTGIATSTISDWRKKKINPQADKLVAICNSSSLAKIFSYIFMVQYPFALHFFRFFGYCIMNYNRFQDLLMFYYIKKFFSSQQFTIIPFNHILEVAIADERKMEITFDFIERMEFYGISKIAEVIEFTVLENLHGADKDKLDLCLKYMGSETKKTFEAIG